MKFLLTLVTFFCFQQVHALDSAGYQKWLALALTTPTEALPKTGPVMCEEEFQINPYVQNDKVRAYGKTVKEAQGFYYLACIKAKCASLGQQIAGAMAEILRYSSSDLADYMTAQGFTQAEIDQAILRKNHINPDDYKASSCMDGFSLQMSMPVDFCFSTPVVCGKVAK